MCSIPLGESYASAGTREHAGNELVENFEWDSIGGAMSTAQLNWISETVQIPVLAAEEYSWYAIQVRCQFEKKASQQLQEKGVEAFVPMVKQRRRWSDRWQVVEFPTFPGYAFVHLHPSPARRLQVLQTRGVMSFVAFGGELIPIPDRQIEDVRVLLSRNVPYTAHPYIKIGQRVRIRGGCLDGIEGILTSNHGDKTLLISVEPIQRSIAVSIADFDIEPA
jgi:transcriptional antiterminator RfaH